MPRGERELNKEGKMKRKTRDRDKNKTGKRRGSEGIREEVQRITKEEEEGERQPYSSWFSLVRR